jgi:hypothetical protein
MSFSMAIYSSIFPLYIHCRSGPLLAAAGYLVVLGLLDVGGSLLASYQDILCSHVYIIGLDY